MSEPESKGIVSAVANVSTSLITALPPTFIMLVLLNTAFLGAVLWFLNIQLEGRMAMANRIIDHCLVK